MSGCFFETRCISNSEVFWGQSLPSREREPLCRL